MTMTTKLRGLQMNDKAKKLIEREKHLLAMRISIIDMSQLENMEVETLRQVIALLEANR